MKPCSLVTTTTTTTAHSLTTQFAPTNPISHLNLGAFSSRRRFSFTFQIKPSRYRWLSIRSSIGPKSNSTNRITVEEEEEEGTLNTDSANINNNVGVDDDNQPQLNRWKVEVGSPTVPSSLRLPKLSLADQAFFLLAFIACTTSVAFTSLVIAAVPTLYAMGRAAISLSKLADTAREELPSTMAAIRLSGMEISDLTLELSDLSHEIADGVNKSAQAVQAAEAGIRKIGSRAREQTMSMIQERANLPTISLQPVVAGAAKKTSHAVGQATKNFMNMISGGENSSDNENGNTVDRLDI